MMSNQFVTAAVMLGGVVIGAIAGELMSSPIPCDLDMREMMDSLDLSWPAALDRQFDVARVSLERFQSGACYETLRRLMGA